MGSCCFYPTSTQPLGPGGLLDELSPPLPGRQVWGWCLWPGQVEPSHPWRSATRNSPSYPYVSAASQPPWPCSSAPCYRKRKIRLSLITWSTGSCRQGRWARPLALAPESVSDTVHPACWPEGPVTPGPLCVYSCLPSSPGCHHLPPPCSLASASFRPFGSPDQPGPGLLLSSPSGCFSGLGAAPGDGLGSLPPRAQGLAGDQLSEYLSCPIRTLSFSKRTRS